MPAAPSWICGEASRRLWRRGEESARPPNLQRLGDLVEAHQARHLLHLGLLLIGEPGDERRRRPMEPLDCVLIDAEAAAVVLGVRLYRLAERAQFGGDRRPVFFLVGGE